MAKKARAKKAQKSPTPVEAPPAQVIIHSDSKHRQYESIMRKQVPADVRNNLSGALTGRLDQQAKMFWAMLDTWPKLQSNIGDMKDAIAGADIEVKAYVDACKCDPTPAAIAKKELVEETIKAMRGDMPKNELGFSDMVKEVVLGYYAPPAVQELYYPTPEMVEAGKLPGVPYAAKSIPPRFYGYAMQGEGDHLRLFRDGLTYGAGEDFAEHKFIIASRLSYPGHPSLAAPMRVMTSYWMAATFGLEWLIEYAQKYGIPFRWATTDKGNVANVGQALASLGAAGYGAFEGETVVNTEPAPSAGASLPQAVLAEMADKKCDLWVRGETLTSDQGSSGSRSLGEVHERVYQKRKEAVAEFAGKVLSDQFIPSLIALNFGDSEEMPTIEITVPDLAKDAGQLEKVGKVIKMQIPVSKEWVYEQAGVPVPDEGDELFEQPEPAPAPGQPGVPGQPGGAPQPGGDQGKPAPGKPKPSKDAKNGEKSAGKVAAAYDPNQPRDPGGEDGGQWISNGAAGSGGVDKVILDPVADAELLARLDEMDKDPKRVAHIAEVASEIEKEDGYDTITLDPERDAALIARLDKMEGKGVGMEPQKIVAAESKANLTILDDPAPADSASRRSAPAAVSESAQTESTKSMAELVKYAKSAKGKEAERLVIVDAKTGERIADTTGKKYSVSVPKDVDLSSSDTIFQHTHPTEISFSDADWGVFTTPGVSQSSVVMPSGIVHRKTKTDEWYDIPEENRTSEALVELWDEEADRLDDIDGGEDEWFEEINLSVSKMMGVRYEIIDASGNVTYDSSNLGPEPEPIIRKTSAARDQSDVDQLVDGVLHGLTGLRPRYFAGVRPFFFKLLSDVENATEEDYLEVLSAASTQLPDQFDNLGTDQLATAMENAQSSAIVTGAAQRLREFNAESSIRAAFDPNQARDEDGKWTKSSGQTSIDSQYPPADPDALDTLDRFTLPDGSITPERQKLHDDIVAELLTQAEPVDNPVARMTGGGSASGKSSIVASGDVEKPDNMVEVDSDEIKKMLPEYNLRHSQGDTGAAAYAHEESSMLSKRAIAESIKTRRNVFLDGTGDSSFESLKRKTEVLRSGDRPLHADYVTVDLPEAIRRSHKRERRIPDKVVIDSHKAVSTILPKALEGGLFDSAALWGTNDGVVKIMEHKNGVTTILDQERWERFLDK